MFKPEMMKWCDSLTHGRTQPFIVKDSSAVLRTYLELDNKFYLSLRATGGLWGLSNECWVLRPGTCAPLPSPLPQWTIENQTLIQPHQPGIYMLMWTFQWHQSFVWTLPWYTMLPGSIWCVFYVIVHPSDGGQGKVYFENLDTKVTHCDVYK